MSLVGVSLSTTKHLTPCLCEGESVALTLAGHFDAEVNLLVAHDIHLAGVYRRYSLALVRWVIGNVAVATGASVVRAKATTPLQPLHIQVPYGVSFS